MLKRTVISIVVFVVSCYASSGAQSPSPAAMTVPQLLQRMTANITGLSSYQVPVHIVAHVKKGPISVPVTMDGDRYFKSPDRSAVKIRSGVPSVAKAFSNTYASLGSPATWPKTYNVVSQSIEDADGHQAYALTATYKKSSNVDHIVLDVDTTTFDPVRVQWFYKNGATVVMHIQEAVVDGKYRLPKHEDVAANFPSYSGSASVDYGTYATNIPIADSVFAAPK